MPKAKSKCFWLVEGGAGTNTGWLEARTGASDVAGSPKTDVGLFINQTNAAKGMWKAGRRSVCFSVLTISKSLRLAAESAVHGSL